MNLVHSRGLLSCWGVGRWSSGVQWSCDHCGVPVSTGVLPFQNARACSCRQWRRALVHVCIVGSLRPWVLILLLLLLLLLPFDFR